MNPTDLKKGEVVYARNDDRQPWSQVKVIGFNDAGKLIASPTKGAIREYCTWKR